MKKTVLSKTDLEIMNFIPEGWFEPYDLPYKFRCRNYRCDKLQKAGVLEWRVVGEIPFLKSQYRRKLNA